MEIPRITPRQVTEAVRRGDRIAFVDARSPSASAEATEQIPGSLRVPPDEVDAHVPSLPRDALVVAYCT